MRSLVRSAALLVTSVVATAVPVAAHAQTAADPGWLLIIDRAGGQAVLVAPDGSAAPVDTTAPLLTAPRGAAVHPDGRSLAVVDGGADPAAGTVLVIAPGGPTVLVAEGLDSPDTIAWLDDITLIVTSATQQTVTRIDVGSGVAEELATLADVPAGVVPFEGFGRSGLLVTTVQGPIELVDPDTGETQPFSTNLQGGGIPSVDDTLGVCVPEVDLDRVRCFAFDGSVGSEFGPLDGPVAVTTIAGGLLVTAANGLAIIDGASGAIRPLAIDVETPVVVAALGNDLGPWASVVQVATTDVPTTDEPTVTEPPATTAVATTANVEPEADPEVEPEPEAGTAATPTTDAPSVAPAVGGGSGFPWWILIAIAGLVALAAIGVLVVRRRRSAADATSESEDASDIGRPQLPFHVRRARAAAAACEARTFWNAYRAAEENVLWLQEGMRNACDVGDRVLFDRLDEQQQQILEALAPTPAQLNECVESDAIDPPSVAPIQAPFAGVAAELARKRQLAELDDAIGVVRRRLDDVDRELTKLRHATAAVESDAGMPTDEPGDRGRLSTAPHVAALCTDDEMVEHYQIRNADEITRRRAAMESANRSYQEALRTYLYSVPSQQVHATAWSKLLALQSDYGTARMSYSGLVPPGETGWREMAQRARQVADDDEDIAQPDADELERRVRARMSELERDRDEANAALDVYRHLRTDLGTPRTTSANRQPPARPIGTNRYFMHIYADVTDEQHVAVGLCGPDFDTVFSVAGDRDTVARMYTPRGWAAETTGDIEIALTAGAFTNEWYRSESERLNHPYHELPVELPAAQFRECQERLLAFACAGPPPEFVPVPGGEGTTRCPSIWIVVRSVFTDMANFGSAWFDNHSALDDALMFLHPEIAGRRLSPFDWDRCRRE